MILTTYVRFHSNHIIKISEIDLHEKQFNKWRSPKVYTKTRQQYLPVYAMPTNNRVSSRHTLQGQDMILQVRLHKQRLNSELFSKKFGMNSRSPYLH